MEAALKRILGTEQPETLVSRIARTEKETSTLEVELFDIKGMCDKTTMRLNAVEADLLAASQD